MTAHPGHPDPLTRPGNGRKVVVAMSGGVDSSVTAALLQQQGYDVVGCFMRLGSEHEEEGVVSDACCNADAEQREASDTCKTSPDRARPHKQGCCSVNDAADARLVAAMLDVPFYVLNFRKDFDRIIDYFVGEYNAGRTPNPCVRCNDWLKFGKLHDYAKSIDADYVASGHYARVDRSQGRARLLRGKDESKDQSYVLFGATRDRVEQMLLPIGEMEKAEVRQIAEEMKLPVFNKPDSQEICFVPDNDYASLVRRRTPEQVEAGVVVDSAGNVVGQHAGQQHFTIGQRRGLGVALGYPIYVTDKNAQTNTVTVGPKDDLLSTRCTADQTNWLTDPPRDWRPCDLQVRYNSPPTPGAVRVTNDDKFEACFDEPVSAVTPGQAIVCYDNDEVLGGGWIVEAE